jgi:pyrimidine 5'-nucleotidase
MTMWNSPLLFVTTSGLYLYLIQRQKKKNWKGQEWQKDFDDNTTTNDTNTNRHKDDSSLLSLLQQSLQDGTSRDGQERICTVTHDNVPTANGNLRSEMRLQTLWHRATYVLVLQPQQNDHPTQSSSSILRPHVLVQKRSSQKDYCPGKLDPTPGGVVGYDESYEENAVREIHEEMGIDVRVGNRLGNTIERLFTFDYQDEHVKVWGDFYVATYNGSIQDLTIQKEEVEEVYTMTLDELYEQIRTHPNNYMPDSCYAIQLYYQRTVDMHVKRKLLKGYSSGDLDKYKLRPKPEVIFFDCDDTLYFDHWQTANQLTAKIEDWCVTNVGLPPGMAYELYKKHGTCLRGLLAEGHIENNPIAIDQFLEEVHDIPIHELIQPDKKLRELLLKIDPTIPKYIFTASVSHHAIRCLKALGIDDIFENTIIDVKECDLETKHSVHSFNAAMRIAQVSDPEACVFLDDSVTNIRAAREVGWRSVLVGTVGRDNGKAIFSDHAELEVHSIHDIQHVLPEIFMD